MAPVPPLPPVPAVGGGAVVPAVETGGAPPVPAPPGSGAAVHGLHVIVPSALQVKEPTVRASAQSHCAPATHELPFFESPPQPIDTEATTTQSVKLNRVMTPPPFQAPTIQPPWREQSGGTGVARRARGARRDW